MIVHACTCICALITNIHACRSQSALETVAEQSELAGEADEVAKDEKPEPLTEKQLNEVPIAGEVFGMEVVSELDDEGSEGEGGEGGERVSALVYSVRYSCTSDVIVTTRMSQHTL